MKNGRNNSNKTLLFLSGIVAGAAATFYLHTPQGKRLTNQVVDRSREMKDRTSEKFNSMAEDVKDSTRSALDSASSYAKDIQNKFRSKTEDVLETSANKTDNLQKGINKAREKVANS